MSPARRKHGVPLVGFHVSIAGSVALAVDRAQELGCTTFQVFTGNPRSWTSSPISAEAATAFREKRSGAGFAKVAAHMPYLANLASSDASTMRLSRAALREGVRRCQLLGIDYLVVHLGTHDGEGTAEGVKNVAEACNAALASSSDAGEGRRSGTVVLLENMAGQGTGIGSRFEEIAAILDRIGDRGRAGVCFDTCHAFVAGYDLTSKRAVEETMGAFDEAVGLSRMKLVHLNDSKGSLGSRLDRHERVGLGRIGTKGFEAFLRHKKNAALPLVMEPPEHDLSSFRGDIDLVRSMGGRARRG